MKGAKELCLEDYVSFFNKENPPLTMNQLSKIVQINGFVKMNKPNKSSLLDALRTVDLIPPGRSTIEECLPRSSNKSDLTLDEIIKDIISIGWQECPIVSILNICNERKMEGTVEISPELKGSGAKRKWKTVEIK